MSNFLDKKGVTYLFNKIKNLFEPTISNQLIDVNSLTTHYYKDSTGVKAITKWDPSTETVELLYPTNCICVQSNGWNCDLNGNGSYWFNSGTDFAHVNEVNDCWFKGTDSTGDSNVYAVLFNTKINLTNTAYMFERCPYLKYVKFPGHNNTINSARSMFRLCGNIDYIDLTPLNFSNCDFDAIFSDCGVHTIKLRGSSNNCGGMFYKCSKLKNLSLELDCNNSTNMGAMFFNCSSLEKLDLSKCPYINKGNWWGIFSGCTSLKSLTLPKTDCWINETATAFDNCVELENLYFPTFGKSNGSWDLSWSSKLTEESLRIMFEYKRSNILVVKVHPDVLELIEESGLGALASENNYSITK